MKVLFHGDRNNVNPYLDSLAKELNKTCVVDFSLYDFWKVCWEYDVLHIHWPESLFMNGNISHDNVSDVDNKLVKLQKKGIKLVCTRHNNEPHNTSILFKRLYNLVLKNANGLIHLGKNSFDQDFEKYDCKQIIIPHHIYEDTPNKVTKAYARNRLNINEKDRVLLIFGQIRHEYEFDLLKELKIYLKGTRIKLIVTQWPWYNQIALRRQPLRKVYRFISNLVYQLSPNYNVFNRLLKDDELQYYFNASDVVLIPRWGTLNSGILPLAFFFGKPVIGPNYGNIGFWLRETSNFYFDRLTSEQVWEQIKKCFDDVYQYEQLGVINQEYAFQNWNVKKIAKAHFQFYSQLYGED